MGITKIGVAGREVAMHARYRGIHVVELEIPDPAPRAATARRWREEIPAGVAVTAHLAWPAPRAPGVEELRLLGAAMVLEPEILVVTTPPALRPGEEGEAVLRAIRAAWSDRPLAWEPLGLWSEAETARLCGELGLVDAADPTQRLPSSRGPVTYLRLRGLGPSSQRYSDKALEQIAAAAIVLQEAAPVYCVFASVNAPRDAFRLGRLLEELGGSTPQPG